jgi:hypothetical protein
MSQMQNQQGPKVKGALRTDAKIDTATVECEHKWTAICAQCATQSSGESVAHACDASARSCSVCLAQELPSKSDVTIQTQPPPPPIGKRLRFPLATPRVYGPYGLKQRTQPRQPLPEYSLMLNSDSDSDEETAV